MKFFQRTGLRDSLSFMDRPEVMLLLQGLCQGNGAAPACWIMLSAVLMHCYARCGHGAAFETPISKVKMETFGTIYVDDADLFTYAASLKTGQEVFEEMQASTYAWCALLNSTGGAAKPEKCAWWLVDYAFEKGEWAYTGTVDWEMCVLLPDETHAPIEQKSADTAVETLGVWGCPSGEDNNQISKLVNRATLWTAGTKNGHLAAKYAWVSYRLNPWPALQYGLATMATPLRVARAALVGLEYKMLSSLGVNRNIKS